MGHKCIFQRSKKYEPWYFLEEGDEWQLKWEKKKKRFYLDKYPLKISTISTHASLFNKRQRRPLITKGQWGKALLFKNELMSLLSG